MSDRDVAGKCPACGWRSLTLTDGGHVVCTRIACPEPLAADRLLDSGVVTDALRRLGRALADAQEALGHLEQPQAERGARRSTHEEPADV